MDETKNFVKQYWPYIVGVIIAIYLIMRSGSSSSTSSTNSGDYAAYLQAQSQAAAINAQAQAQQNQLTAAAAIAQQNYQLQEDTLNLQSKAIAGQQQIDYLNAQGNVAQSIGGAAAQLVGALYQPVVAAQATAAAENSAALQTAGAVAAAGFGAQAQISANASTAIGSVAQGLQTFGNIKVPQSNFQSLLGTASQLGSAALVGSSTFGNRNFL